MGITTITIKIPDRQKDYLMSQKDETGLNMSDYLRRLIDRDIQEKKPDLVRVI